MSLFVAPVATSAVSNLGGLGGNAEVQSIGDMALKAYSNMSVESTRAHAEIMNQMNVVASDGSPGQLMHLQVLAADYSNNVGLVMALAKKATSAVETVVKA